MLVYLKSYEVGIWKRHLTRVEERETGVITEERETSLEEVDAMSRKFSLSLKAKKNKKKTLIIPFWEVKSRWLWYHRFSENTWRCYTRTTTVKTVLWTNSSQVQVSSRYTSEIKPLWNIFISGYITQNRLFFSLKQGTKPDKKSSKVFWCTGSLQEASAEHTSLSFKMNRCKLSSYF